GPHVLAGSHIESQNQSGWLDGALGVIYALEAARAVAEDPAMAGRGVDVIAFVDEEGHFGQFLGSYSFAGQLDEATIDAATDRSGRGPMRSLLGEAGLAGVPRVTMDPARYRAFFEAHIEQGRRLEAEGLTIGVVTSIIAIWQYKITVEGAQNHAGTTTMAERRDAGTAMMRIWRRIEERFPDVIGQHSVWTVGRTELTPGAPSIIPGHAEMLFQFRDAEMEVLERLHEALAAIVAEVDAEGPCTARLTQLARPMPGRMDPSLQAALVASGEALTPGRTLVMPSAAGHDAQIMSQHLPSAMMFVPSIGGVSHHWTEDTSDADIKDGAAVFVDAIARVLAADGG
ncbi:MAG: hydantoinase/carbamoylase family amidase, partial [Pseudomonadota bacterium]